MNNLETLRSKCGYLCDMDGVLYHGERLLPGVTEFVHWLEKEQKQYLFLTNASGRTPLELQQKLARMGLEVGEDKFYTSALATAQFLHNQSPGCSAYIIGDPGLFNALYDYGITQNDHNPDYVVVGETRAFGYEHITRAIYHVRRGAKLIGTNSDMTAPSETGIIPACRALIAPIELASERQAYFIGKPNALMMRTGLRILGVKTSEAAMIGDRMDTDIVAGMETGLDTVLVLSGVTDEARMQSYPYRPTYVLDGVGDIPNS
ncbi:MAG: HAD-IIA family hydrolase [Oscillospiraceae bacterium]|nr:HAD-IIA family hydrolase [Oscillospiraceae bacterium]